MKPFPRSDFPLIHEAPYQPFCYADNAATTQMPQVVIEEMAHYARFYHSNVHRAPYRLATTASLLYEENRAIIAKYFRAQPECVFFTKNATEGLNLLASSLSSTMSSQDAVILSIAEHHSQIVPWQQAAEKVGFAIYWADLDASGQISLASIEKICSEHKNVKVIATLAASNSTGVIQPIKQICDFARARQITTVIDACQMGLDADLGMDCGADFMVVSAHKMFGPTGVGAVFASPQAAQTLEVYQTGGGMIRSVSTTHSTFQDIPHRFEAGTPALQAVAGWAAAVKYIESFDKLYRMRWTQELVEYGLKVFSQLPGYQLLFPEQHHRLPVFSITHQRLHPHDLGTYLDHLHGIAARAGHHCTMPLMQYLGVGSTLRLSFCWYNTKEEIDACARALIQAQEFFNV